MKTNALFLILLMVVALGTISMNNPSDLQDKPWDADAEDDENIGKILYSKHCKSCHGTKGKGDGNKAASIDTPIGDFTDGSIASQSDGSIYYKTIFGRDDMPSFEKKIADEEERWLVVNYVKKLAE